jgi:RNA polymerase sigma factor (sigma-70 family)
MNKLTDPQRQDVLAELPALRRYCLSLVGQVADADDLLQNTVERVLERGMPPATPAAKWMFRVCKNIWIDELRYRQVRVRLSDQVAREARHNPTVEEEAFAALNMRLVLKAMDSLPEEQRATLSLVAIEGKSYAEASEILEVPAGTIMSRVARSRRALADYFEEHNLQEAKTL